MDDKLLLLLLLLLSLHARLWFCLYPSWSFYSAELPPIDSDCKLNSSNSRRISREFHWRQWDTGIVEVFPSVALHLIYSTLNWRVNVDDGGRRIRRSSGWFGFRAAKPASLMHLAAALPGGFPRWTRGQRGSSTGQHQGWTWGRPGLQSGARGRNAGRAEASSRRPGTHRRDAPMPGWRGARCDRTAAQSQILAAERMGEPVLRGSHYPRHWEHPRKETHAVTDIRLDGPLCALFQG